MNANIIVPTLLFILLTPGFLFTIPSNFTQGFDRIFGGVQTTTIILHAILFALLLYILRRSFPQYY